MGATTTAPATAADVLNAAADLIEENGWCQGWSEDSLGRHCTLGAVAAVGKPEPAEVITNAVEHLRRATGVVGVASWNDEDGRTKEEVVETLRKAAALAEA